MLVGRISNILLLARKEQSINRYGSYAIGQQKSLSFVILGLTRARSRKESISISLTALGQLSGCPLLLSTVYLIQSNSPVSPGRYRRPIPASFQSQAIVSSFVSSERPRKVYNLRPSEESSFRLATPTLSLCSTVAKNICLLIVYKLPTNLS